MHGLKGGSWKRSVGHGHRSWAPGGNPGDERRAYRHHTSPRQLPTRHGRFYKSMLYPFLRRINEHLDL